MTSPPNLEAWEATYIGNESGIEEGMCSSMLKEDDPEYFLPQLDALVVHIADLSEVEDLLALRITRTLHSIPLRAL